jgi:tRNA-specific 2-thiouridylase
LFTIPPSLIPKLLFPVGDMKKPDVRAYAEKNNLVVARKKDSTGICFVGNAGYDNFIEEHYPNSPFKPGLIKRYPHGEVMTTHTGIHHFTYGQRKGLGFAAEAPLYVIKVDAENGDVWVGEEKYLFSDEVKVERCQWHVPPQPGQNLRVKIRYAHKGGSAKISVGDNGQCVIKFDEPQRAVTPGQAAVVYDGDRLLGGGWIT